MRKKSLTGVRRSARLPLLDYAARGIIRFWRAFVNTFFVPVRNELTGEVLVVEIASGYFADAQVSALQQVFKREGWRKATALRPDAADSRG